MAGFIKRLGNSTLVTGISDTIRNISNLGMKYDDKVVSMSKAVGTTEAQFSAEGPLPQDLLYSLAMSDIGPKKYIAFFDKDYKSRREFLRKFAMNGEIEWILDTIADETIVYDEKNFFCRPDTTGIVNHIKEELKDEILNKIENNFKWIYNAFHFNDDISAWQIFKQFLIDGFLSFEIIYNEKGDKILGFKELDPTSLRPAVINTPNGFKRVWMQYEEIPNLKRQLLDSQIIYISYSKGSIVSRASYTERLVRSFNLLRLMENTRLIWNLMNSTYRMKMVVPIGTKSVQKAKESLNELLAIYKEDVYLDTDSGELLINGKPSMQFYKNYLFPSKNGEQPDIETIASDGPDLNSTESLQYFWDKLKQDSKIPFSRWDKSSGAAWAIGADGLDREEIRFAKFINRLRSVFQEIIVKPLWIQMSLDYPELADDEIFKSNLGIKFNKDNVFEEMKNIEIAQKRLEFMTAMKDYTMNDGSTPYFDAEFLVKYLQLSKDELDENAAIKKKNLITNTKDADTAATAGSW